MLGYDLDMMNMTELEDNSNLKREVPSVVLVKKTYPKYRKKNRKQAKFQLKQLDKETVDEHNVHKKDKGNVKHQRDYELFIQDILEDTDIRNQIDLYKTDGKKKASEDDEDEDESVEEDFPTINEVDLKTIEDKLTKMNLHEDDFFEESKIN